jgi:hypothetical protein
VLDGHPATLAWLGAVNGHRVRVLRVDTVRLHVDLRLQLQNRTTEYRETEGVPIVAPKGPVLRLVGS